MANDAVRFIRKDGHIIPIRAAAAAGAHAASKVSKTAKFARHAVVGAGAIVAATEKKKSTIKVNKKAELTGLGLSIASGAIGAATFSSPAKFLAGSILSHTLDAFGIAANVASVSGKGHKIERAKQAAKQETRSFIIGNAVYAAGILGFKSNRETAVTAIKKGAGYAGKALSLARKILRVEGV